MISAKIHLTKVVLFFSFVLISVEGFWHTKETSHKSTLLRRYTEKRQMNYQGTSLKQLLKIQLSNGQIHPGLMCSTYEDCDFDLTILMCQNDKCICPVNFNFGYIHVNTTWNAEKGVCMSQIGSGCDLIASEKKQGGIQCDFGLICVQFSTLPVGMGFCVPELSGNEI